MKQCKKFQNPVYAAGGNNIIASASDSIDLILKDGTVQSVTLTDASADGRWICWDQASSAAAPRAEDVRAVESAHHWDCTKYGGAENPAPTALSEDEPEGEPQVQQEPCDPSVQQKGMRV